MNFPRPLLSRKDTGLRHHPEDEVGTARRKKKKKKNIRSGSIFLYLHSCVRRLPELQQWSQDGAAKAGLIHVLLLQEAG